MTEAEKSELLLVLDVIKQNGINIRARYNRLSGDQIIKAVDRAIELVSAEAAATTPPLVKK